MPPCAGVYGSRGLQVVAVTYQFGGSKARISAVKVTGDQGVPAGEGQGVIALPMCHVLSC